MTVRGLSFYGSLVTRRVFGVLILHTCKTTAVLHAGKRAAILHTRERAAVSGSYQVAARMMIMIVYVVTAVSFGDLIDMRVKLDELVGDDDESGAGVAAKTREFNAHPFVGNRVDRVREIFIDC